MRPKVYIETSVIGYLASRPSRDLITAANQQLTHDWWNDHRSRFDLFVSQFVIDECSDGNAEAAQSRLRNLTGIGRLEAPEQVVSLAAELIDEVPLPESAEIDALHIAVAAPLKPNLKRYNNTRYR
jgi:hypothetical protein